MGLRAAWLLSAQLFAAKISTDAIDKQRNITPTDMPDFFTEFMTTRFGLASLAAKSCATLTRAVLIYSAPGNLAVCFFHILQDLTNCALGQVR